MRIYIDLILYCCLLVGTYTRTARATADPEHSLRGGDQHLLSESSIEKGDYQDPSRDQQWVMLDNGLTKAVQWSAVPLLYTTEEYIKLADLIKGIIQPFTSTPIRFLYTAVNFIIVLYASS